MVLEAAGACLGEASSGTICTTYDGRRTTYDDILYMYIYARRNTTYKPSASTATAHARPTGGCLGPSPASPKEHHRSFFLLSSWPPGVPDGLVGRATKTNGIYVRNTMTMRIWICRRAPAWTDRAISSYKLLHFPIPSLPVPFLFPLFFPLFLFLFLFHFFLFFWFFSYPSSSLSSTQ